MIVAMEQLA